MPFYDYKCNKCAKKFEVMHGMNSKPANLKCESCGAADMQRVFYPVGRIGGGEESDHSHSAHGKSCSSCSSGGCGSCG